MTTLSELISFIYLYIVIRRICMMYISWSNGPKTINLLLFFSLITKQSGLVIRSGGV